MRSCCILLCLALLSAVPSSGEDFALRDGDRVVFYGDSITQDGTYASTIEQFVLTRFPSWKLDFVNAGVGGDTVRGGWAGDLKARLQRDLLPYRPTVVTVMLGMNDAAYRPFDPERLAAYKDGYSEILSQLQGPLPGVRLTVIRPSAFDDVTRPPQFPGGYDDVLRRYGCVAEGLGRAAGATVVDLRVALNDALRKLKAQDPALAAMLIPDRVHPSRAGHLVMAGALLRAWRGPAIVTSVKIAGAEPRTVGTVRTSVTGLEKTPTGLRWQQADQALPLPLDFSHSDVSLAESAGAGLLALDQQLLEVTGLEVGRYQLLIDGKPVTTASEAELAAGLNLSAFDTPMLARALPASWLVPEAHQIHRVRRALLAGGAEDEGTRQAVASLEALEASTKRGARETVTPGLHDYQLSRIPK
jgi:lysophospholipase L1-like esterase